MKLCPICNAKLRSMITNDPIVSHQLVEGYECGYDSVYDTEEPIEEDEDDED